jgi:hypothetical protein
VVAIKEAELDRWILIALSIYGAILSTALGIIRFLEWRRTRVRITVDRIWRDNSSGGNDLLIKNESTVPISIVNYDIVAAKSEGDDSSVTYLVETPVSFRNIKVEGLSARELSFTNEEHFSIASKHGKVFLRLWTVGRVKPLWFDLT